MNPDPAIENVVAMIRSRSWQPGIEATKRTPEEWVNRLQKTLLDAVFCIEYAKNDGTMQKAWNTEWITRLVESMTGPERADLLKGTARITELEQEVASLRAQLGSKPPTPPPPPPAPPNVIVTKGG